MIACIETDVYCWSIFYCIYNRIKRDQDPGWRRPNPIIKENKPVSKTGSGLNFNQFQSGSKSGSKEKSRTDPNLQKNLIRIKIDQIQIRFKRRKKIPEQTRQKDLFQIRFKRKNMFRIRPFENQIRIVIYQFQIQFKSKKNPYGSESPEKPDRD